MLVGLYGFVFFTLLSLAFYNLISASFIYSTIYTFLEYIFFASIFWNNIQIKKLRLVMVLGTLLFITSQGLTFLNISNLENNAMDSIPIGIETILIFVYIILFFYQNFRNNYDQYIYYHHCFWISIGIMIYLGGTFFFNILANYIQPAEIDKYWYLTHIADIIKNVFFCVAIIVLSRGQLKEKLFHHSSVPYLDLDMN